MKKTGWYPPHIKPVRVGLYEGTIDGWYRFNVFWDKEQFRCPHTGGRYSKGILYWRGLTEEAK